MLTALLTGTRGMPWWVLGLEEAEGIKAPWEMPGNWLMWQLRWERLRELRYEAREMVKKQ